ncbi:MAG: ABC transporter ATP-binding protein/permease [Chloroflexota bacterium]
MDWAIETFHLSKYFPQTLSLLPLHSHRDAPQLVVKDVNLRVKDGELFGLVGPNGAGKTTLIKLLCTLITPCSGTAHIKGYDLNQQQFIKSVVGLSTGDERSFYWRLTGSQNLDFFSTMFGLFGEEKDKRIAWALEQVGLTEAAHKPVQVYSNGMRKRLGIARALLNNPSLLYLDEPTNDLDPIATERLHTLIRSQLVEKEGITVFLTTHRLTEAEKLCNRIAIMHQGEILACGSLDELRQQSGLSEDIFLCVGGLTKAMHNTLSKRFSLQTHKQDDDETRITLPDEQTASLALSHINQLGAKIISYQRRPVTLETIFKQLVEKPSGASTKSPPAPVSLPPSTTHLSQQTQPVFHQMVARVKHGLRVAWAFLKRDVRSEISYRVAFFLSFLNILFSVAVFYFISKLIGPTALPYLEPYGGDYFAFVLIGIAIAGYFGVGLSGFANSLRQAQTTGTLEAMLTTPTPVTTIILSSSLWSYLLTTLRFVVYLAVGVLLSPIPINRGNYPLAFLILLLTIGAFSSLGIIAASFIMVLKRGDPITWVFNAFAGLLGGVYFPLTILPSWLQTIAKLFPITYALEAMRKVLLQGASFQEVWIDLMALTIFCFAGVPLSLIVFRMAVQRAKVEGSLTHY